MGEDTRQGELTITKRVLALHAGGIDPNEIARSISASGHQISASVVSGILTKDRNQRRELVRRANGTAHMTKTNRRIKEAATERRRATKAADRRAQDDAVAANMGRMLPTPERERHGSIVEQTVTATDDEAAKAGAKVRRAQSPIERYTRRGSLTERQADAAADLRQDWEFGIAGASNSGTGGVRIGGTMAGFAVSQLDAATRYREAVQAMGKRVSDVVLPIVIGMADGGEITAGMLAKRRGDPSEQQVMGVLRTGLDMLGDHYASCSNKQRAAKYG